MEVTPKFGAKIYRWKGAVQLDPDVMEDVCMKRGDKMKGVSSEGGDLWDIAKRISFDKFFLWDPELFSTIVNDVVLMRVAVIDKGTHRGSKEVGKEVG